MMSTTTKNIINIEITNIKSDSEDHNYHEEEQESTSSDFFTDGYLILNGKKKVDHLLHWAVLNAWLINWLLLIIKAICVWLSSSKSVTAALVDSVVDLASQAVLSLAERYIGRHSPDYPVGRSRLEALSVLGCASIMIMASIEVIQFSIVGIVLKIHQIKFNGQISFKKKKSFCH